MFYDSLLYNQNIQIKLKIRIKNLRSIFTDFKAIFVESLIFRDITL